MYSYIFYILVENAGGHRQLKFILVNWLYNTCYKVAENLKIGHWSQTPMWSTVNNEVFTKVNLKPGQGRQGWSQFFMPGHGPPHDLSQTKPHPLAKVSGHYLQRLKRSRGTKFIFYFFEL